MKSDDLKRRLFEFFSDRLEKEGANEKNTDVFEDEPLPTAIYDKAIVFPSFEGKAVTLIKKYVQ